ncbi:MAG: acyl-CoA thioesterase [Myxococcales bacterium]|nr:acyl-CoA thioesterase [Myxococcales bacterium]MCB9705053.1 acyl-CoA thioesterase [Myxococcales bacterium]
MPAVYDFVHQVDAAEIDELGHVGNLRYLAWIVDAATAHSSAEGWPPARYHELGACWVVRSHAIEYLRPAFAGEAIVVRTWVAEIRRVESRRRYRILRPADGALLATAETRWIWVGVPSLQPRRIPPEVAGAFTAIDDPGDDAPAAAGRPPTGS